MKQLRREYMACNYGARKRKRLIQEVTMRQEIEGQL